NEDGTDDLKKFSNQSQKFIKMAYIYGDNIIVHLKKEYFAKSKRITNCCLLFDMKNFVQINNGHYNFTLLLAIIDTNRLREKYLPMQSLQHNLSPI
ncbi:3289_t:CDS:2, partial [Dentiscutata heterogama]